MKSSRELIQEAKDYQFNPKIPLKLYLKTCVGILDKAQMSVQCGDTELAFMFYYRYVDLCTNKLSRHPQYLTSNTNLDSEVQLYREEYLQLMKLEVPAVLKLLEDLQTQINRNYCKHQLSLAKNIAKSNKTNTLHSINNTNERRYHSRVIGYDSMDSDIKCPLLPPAFNEHRLNQSLDFFKPVLTRGVDNNNGNNNNDDSHINAHTNVLDHVNSNESDNSNPNDSSRMFHYPELPQLSFPTC